jgi:hypothetical protein
MNSNTLDKLKEMKLVNDTDFGKLFREKVRNPQNTTEVLLKIILGLADRCEKLESDMARIKKK